MGERYELPLFPLNLVLFPGMVLPLHIFEERYKEMIQRCLSNGDPFGVVLLKSGHTGGKWGEIHDVGTVADITQVKRLQGDRMNIVSLGTRRFRLLDTLHNHSYLTGLVEDFPLEESNAADTFALTKKLMKRLARYLQDYRKVGRLNINLQKLPDDPNALVFLTAMLMPISNEEKQELLSTANIVQLLQKEYALLQHEANILEILADERPVQQNDQSSFSLN